MTLANTRIGPEKVPTEKFWRLGASLHHRTVRQFTINKWWHDAPSLCSLCMAWYASGNGVMECWQRFLGTIRPSWRSFVVVLIFAPMVFVCLFVGFFIYFY